MDSGIEHAPQGEPLLKPVTISKLEPKMHILIKNQTPIDNQSGTVIKVETTFKIFLLGAYVAIFFILTLVMALIMSNTPRDPGTCEQPFLMLFKTEAVVYMLFIVIGIALYTSLRG